MLEVPVGGSRGGGACCCCALSFIAFMRRVRNSRLLCVYWCVITRDKLPSSFPHLLPTPPPPPHCRVACSPFGTSNWPDSCSQINVSRWQLPPGSTTVYDSFARTTVAAQQQGAWPRVGVGAGAWLSESVVLRTGCSGQVNVGGELGIAVVFWLLRTFYACFCFLFAVAASLRLHCQLPH